MIKAAAPAAATIHHFPGVVLEGMLNGCQQHGERVSRVHIMIGSGCIPMTRLWRKVILRCLADFVLSLDAHVLQCVSNGIQEPF